MRDGESRATWNLCPTYRSWLIPSMAISLFHRHCHFLGSDRENVLPKPAKLFEPAMFNLHIYTQRWLGDNINIIPDMYHICQRIKGNANFSLPFKFFSIHYPKVRVDVDIIIIGIPLAYANMPGPGSLLDSSPIAISWLLEMEG